MILQTLHRYAHAYCQILSLFISRDTIRADSCLSKRITRIHPESGWKREKQQKMLVGGRNLQSHILPYAWIFNASKFKANIPIPTRHNTQLVLGRKVKFIRRASRKREMCARISKRRIIMSSKHIYLPVALYKLWNHNHNWTLGFIAS